MLTRDEMEVIKFNSCVIKALKNELKYRKRSKKNRAKRFVNFSDLSKADEEKLCCNDEYEVELFKETITTTLFDAVIHNEMLHKALMSLKDSNREIILLKYWGDMTDSEIGQALAMSQQMVNYNRNKTLKALKILIEELKEYD